MKIAYPHLFQIFIQLNEQGTDVQATYASQRLGLSSSNIQKNGIYALLCHQHTYILATGAEVDRNLLRIAFNWSEGEGVVGLAHGSKLMQLLQLLHNDPQSFIPCVVVVADKDSEEYRKSMEYMADDSTQDSMSLPEFIMFIQRSANR
uniref:Uncharacterized protein n=1 Tax=Fundulus heteroclitus TaxID=8078 RepID=A0A146RD43_FUNHE